MAELKIIIDDKLVDLERQDASPALISYNLEDETDFQKKSSANAFDVTVPATLNNDQIFNTFRNPGILDLTPDNNYRKPRPARISVDNIPVLVGKGLLKGAKSGPLPGSYTINFYGDNGDWMVDMQDLTLFDCLPTNTHTYTLANIQASWLYNGTTATQSWVYAPVRYAQAFADGDTNVRVTDMRPSLFIYWIIQRAFAKFGYKISSQFMDSNLFRRLVMPWTFGDFLGINSKLADLLKFKAVGPIDGQRHIFNYSEAPYGKGHGGSGIIRPGVISNGAHNPPSDDFNLENTSNPYGFDNFPTYSFDWINGLWIWTYKEVGGHFGIITAYFGVSCNGYVTASWASTARIYMDVYRNNTIEQVFTVYEALPGSTNTVTDSDANRVINFQVSGLVVGDQVKIRFRFDFFKSYTGQVDLDLIASEIPTNGVFSGTSFQLFRIAIEPGGTVDWKNFEQFKKFKFLDFLRGVLDIADIIPKTDPIGKTVVMEPSHPVDFGATKFSGYFNTNRLDWTNKRDLSQEQDNENYTDLLRDYLFRMKYDDNDGALQVFKKRYGVDPAAAKFRFNNRFKDGNQTFENRFFSSVMHVKMSQWKNITGTAFTQGRTPQLVAIVPENISNTSAGESEYDFQPKICFYKGYIYGAAPDGSGAGCWKFNGTVYTSIPFMFAVNYLDNGISDIALTYNDQRVINGVGAAVLVPGLLRRFYLQRMAILDNGVRIRPFLFLNNNDVTNWMHRERIFMNGNQYLLTNIDKWDPVSPESAQCTLWKFVPVEEKHAKQIFPSTASVVGTSLQINTPDLAYQQMFILYSDLPTYSS